MKVVIHVAEADLAQLRVALSSAATAFERLGRSLAPGDRKAFWRGRAVRFRGYAEQVKAQQIKAAAKEDL